MFNKSNMNKNLSNLYFSRVTAQPVKFSYPSTSTWAKNYSTNFPFVNISGIKTRIST
jgi:hypothetical protein